MKRTTGGPAIATDDAGGLAPHDMGTAIDRLHRAAVALCGSPHDADDLVQETLVRVLARPRVVRGGDGMPYLLGAIRNTFLTQRRHEVRRPRPVALIDEVEAPDRRAAALPDAVLEHAGVVDALAALPAELRQVLVAVDVVGLSYRETAVAVRLPEGTVMSRLHRARRRVVCALEADGITPAVAQRTRGAATAGITPAAAASE